MNNSIVDSKRCIRCDMVKHLSEFWALKTSRDGLNRSCKVCLNAYHAVWRAAHPGQHVAYGVPYRLANIEKIAARTKAWQANNPEKVVAYGLAYRAADPDGDKARHRAYRAANSEKIKVAGSVYQRANREKLNAKAARRRATKIGATPAWANEFFIEEIYDLAQRRTSATGFVWHVDHIVPLKGRRVCGLHVENNLRVIPGVMNLQKRNKFNPDELITRGFF